MENDYTQEEKEILEKLNEVSASFMLSKNKFDNIMSNVVKKIDNEIYVTEKKSIRYNGQAGVIQSFMDYIHTAQIARVVMVPLAIILIIAGGATLQRKADAQSIQGITTSMSQDIGREYSEEQILINASEEAESLPVIDYNLYEI